MPSKQSEAVRRYWAAARVAMDLPPDEQPDTESWGDLTAEPRGVDYEETTAAGLPAMWAVPKDAARDRVLLCMHGGGYLGGSIYSHRKMFGHLAKAAGTRALIFDYHLTPEHTYPTQVREAVAVYRWLLDQYIASFENADTAALERALRTDAAIELVGTRAWFAGRVTCLRFLTHVVGSPGDWRMVPTSANGQPAVAAYQRADDGTHRAFGVAVLTVTDTGIARIVVFGGGPDLVARFDLPATRL